MEFWSWFMTSLDWYRGGPALFTSWDRLTAFDAIKDYWVSVAFMFWRFTVLDDLTTPKSLRYFCWFWFCFWFSCSFLSGWPWFSNELVFCSSPICFGVSALVLTARFLAPMEQWYLVSHSVMEPPHGSRSGASTEEFVDMAEVERNSVDFIRKLNIGNGPLDWQAQSVCPSKIDE